MTKSITLNIISDYQLFKYQQQKYKVYLVYQICRVLNNIITISENCEGKAAHFKERYETGAGRGFNEEMRDLVGKSPAFPCTLLKIVLTISPLKD